jgi:DNA polymerase III subunit alpha
MVDFVHLHVHTQYSILDGASDIFALVEKAKTDGQKALAITDHGNMFGVKEFLYTVKKSNSKIKEALKEAENKGEPTDELQKMIIKPIIGCEMYVARSSRFEKKGKENLSGDHLIVLAKNLAGYHNLAKLVSIGYVEGFYSKPRIDKELLQQYHEGLIVSTACLGGEIPRALALNDFDKAEGALLWYKNLFGSDFYIELMRHPDAVAKADHETFPKQQIVNRHLIELSKKHDIKLIATNDVHFVNEEDAEAHDILLCLNTGSDFYETNRLIYTKQEWMKTRQEMLELFNDVPEALTNTVEVADKIEFYEIDCQPLMPDFPLPEGFDDPDAYLEYLTYEGAKNRYGEISVELKELIDFELATIRKMGFPGYFLIVHDFIAAARRMGVSVGPGRGSVAGSVVAFCLRITDIDPIKYDLLFERFLNPDRISMPDIDIDFDDDGRKQVLDYVTEKYGKDKVAHIITFGTMAAKSSIRDVGRVLKLPLSETDRLAKLVPDGPKVSLKSAYENVKELADARNSGNPLIAETLKYAWVLEGSVRNTGIHACGVIIGKDNLTNYIPLSIAKEKDSDEDVLVTQYEGKWIEEVGLLKMDFLGLKTLSIIRDALVNIKLSKGIELDIDSIPFDDLKTFELYSRGDTVGTFQFESEGMRKYLRDLKPNKFEDLIAMNALYRPGPIEYIPKFISRKHGKEKIFYDFPVMEKRLSETYGITVYQEQVMLLSRDMAGFSRGDSDKLRKAMGKKQKDVMDTLKVKFIEGCKKNNLEEEKASKVWTDWEKFAEYAFNKSHSTCYSHVAYQTAFLKAHYPAEYMAAVLSRNLSDIKKISFFMDECKRMGINVLGPDVNESNLQFTVNANGDIRFGLAAIKGVGGNAVNCIVDERNKNGLFKSIYDLVERINIQTVNKKNLEALAVAGALDGFEVPRACYFSIEERETGFTENLIRYSNKMQNDKGNSSQTLFGESGIGIEIQKPEIPKIPEWAMLEKLKKEREAIGIYLSAHPLDPYRFELENLCSHSLSDLSDLNTLKGKEITVAGLITEYRQGMTKTNKPYGSIVIEDFSDSFRFNLFGKDYIELSRNFGKDWSVLIKARIQPRQFGDTKELEFKPLQVYLLNEARENLIKSISLKVSVEDVNDDLITDLSNSLDIKDGKVFLKFIICDPSDNLKVNMLSRTMKVKVSNEFINFIRKYPEIEVMMN